MYPTVIRGARLNDQIVECGRLFGHKPACLVPGRVLVRLRRKTTGKRERHPEDRLDHALGLLWSQAGFVRSSSLKDEQRHVLEED